MNFLKSMRNLFSAPSKTEGHPFYDISQEFRVSLSAEVQNTAADIRSILLIFPVPNSNEYQQIKSDILFSPEGCFRAADSLYNNRYAWWRLRIAGRETLAIRETFEITVKPLECGLTKGSLDDYARLSSRLYKRYREPNTFLNPADPRIQRIVHETIGSEKGIGAVLSLLNEYVVSRLVYGNPIIGLYPFSAALEKEKVDCGGFATILVSLLIAAGIPARIVSGFFAGYKENLMHAWVEALLPDGNWFPLDPSMEKLSREGKTKKSGRIGFVGSDRVAFSTGCDIPIFADGKEVRADILQNPIIIAEGYEKDFLIKTMFSATFIK